MKLVIANWKMNPQTYAQAEGLVKSVLEYGDENVVVCPPFPWLTDFSHKHHEVSWGAQDVFYEEQGAYTGEVSVGMLRDAGVKYVIVGHSERRELGDTDEIVAKKLKAVLEGGLMPILCVGEWEREKRNEKAEMKKEKEFVRKQLEGAFKGLGTNDSRSMERIVIAYEPVWAISARSGGASDTPESAGEILAFIKEALRLRSGHTEPKVLYGGSVNGENARGFLELPGCDGVLVGGASLRAGEFRKIVQTADNC